MNEWMHEWMNEWMNESIITWYITRVNYFPVPDVLMVLAWECYGYTICLQWAWEGMRGNERGVMTMHAVAIGNISSSNDDKCVWRLYGSGLKLTYPHSFVCAVWNENMPLRINHAHLPCSRQQTAVFRGDPASEVYRSRNGGQDIVHVSETVVYRSRISSYMGPNQWIVLFQKKMWSLYQYYI